MENSPGIEPTPTPARAPFLQPSIGPVRVHHHFLAPLIFFVLLEIGAFLLGYSVHGLTGAYILGTVIMTLGATGVFAFLAWIFRKIAAKFGNMWKWILWAVVIAALIGGYFYWSSHLPKTYLYNTPGVIYMSDHQISLDECKTTTNDQVKNACGTGYAISTKDRTLCRTIYGNNLSGYYCEYNYDSYYHTSPLDIAECQSMINTQDTAFYKNSCYFAVATNLENKQICSAITDPTMASNCVGSMAGLAYEKANLCGPLFVAGKPAPSSSECSAYVYSLRNVAKCNLLESAWDKSGCLDYVKSFITYKSAYEAKNAAAPKAIADFDSRTDLKNNCSYTGAGSGTALGYSGKCTYALDSTGITAKFTNSSLYPILFSTSTVSQVFDDTNESISLSCPKVSVTSIDGGPYYGVQIDLGETFVLHLSCVTGSFGKLKEILFSQAFGGSARNAQGSLMMQFSN